MNAKELGSQFVYPQDPGYCDGANGLTKRELFAAMAMQGIIAGPVVGTVVAVQKEFDRSDISLCEAAVAYADKLLAELAKDQL